MCKTYDAIFEIKKSMESDELITWVGKVEVRGRLSCNCGCDDEKCQDGVVMLEDVTVKCKECGDRKFKRLNIPSKHIKAFCFACCEE